MTTETNICTRDVACCAPDDEPCDRCWQAKLDAAGGPAPITEHGAAAAIQGGLLSRDEDGGLVFQWRALPVTPNDNANRTAAIAARHQFIHSEGPYWCESNGGKLRMTPLLKEAICTAAEAGVLTKQGMADWLGTTPDKLHDQWLMSAFVDAVAVQTLEGNRVIEAMSPEWGLDRPVSADYIATRRKRLGLTNGRKKVA